jgi:hypothetical protein
MTEYSLYLSNELPKRKLNYNQISVTFQEEERIIKVGSQLLTLRMIKELAEKEFGINITNVSS